MPYIPKARRHKIDVFEHVAQDVGELTYVLTGVAVRYLDSSAGRPRFRDHAEVIAAFEAAKLEFYRRIVAPYEDQKRRENGDVYGPLEQRLQR